MPWKNLGMVAMVFATALLAGGCNPIDPLGLSSNAVADYEWTDGKFGIESDAMVAVAVVDRRNYVLNGDRPPKYTGLVRDGFGIPFDAVTQSQRSLAEDFAISIVAGLRAAGIKAEAPKHSPTRSLEQLRKDLMQANADRYVLLILNQWKTDTYQSTALYYAMVLTIYGRDGVERLRKDFVGKDEGRSVALTPKGRNAEMVGQLYPARLKETFEDEEVAAALQFVGQSVNPSAGETPSVGTSEATASAAPPASMVSETPSVTIAQPPRFVDAAEQDRIEAYIKSNKREFEITLTHYIKRSDPIVRGERYLEAFEVIETRDSQALLKIRYSGWQGRFRETRLFLVRWEGKELKILSHEDIPANQQS